jgi:phytol kinase
MAAVLVALTAVLAALSLAARRVDLHPEVRRKLVHVGMGLVALAFPWMFADPAWVAATAAAAVALLLLVRFQPALRAGPGAVLHGVARGGLGEVYFAAAIAALFWAAHATPAFYVVPVLVLTLADAVAALIGVGYGRLRYQGRGGAKSWEGSAAFFTVAFLACHLPLLLMTDVGRAESVLIGLVVGLLGTLIEGASWDGLDNLLVPLGIYLLLDGFAGRGAGAVGLAAAVLAGLVGVALLWADRTGLKADALMTAVVAGFVFWVSGGWAWLVPPLLLFLAHPLVAPPAAAMPALGRDARTVLAVAAPGVLWAFVAEEGLVADAFYPFALSFTLHLAMIAAFRAGAADGAAMGAGAAGQAVVARVAPMRLLALTTAAWAVTMAPFVAVAGPGGPAPLLALAALPLAWPAAWVFLRLERQSNDTHRLERQAAIALAGSAAGLVPLAAVGLGRL